MRKRIGIFLTAAVMLLGGCSLDDEDTSDDNVDSQPKEESQASKEQYKEGDTWAVYLYMCGSDLESQGSAATEDLQEIMDVNNIPDNVKVVVEAGGTAQWQNDYMDANALNRYVYDSSGMNMISQESSANMGDTQTLQDFLSFCKDNYDADHKMAIFWNHGGGSVSGVCFDEVYNYDSLTLEEIHTAFENVYDLSKNAQPLDMVGFDACLMATVDTADTLSDIAKYMVASEETEPGNGWYYTGWLDKFADNSAITAQDVGVGICDSYMEGCKLYGTEDQTTLSLVDLNKIDSLLTSYNNLGAEALRNAYDDTSFLTYFSKDADKAVNYGGNNKSEGYTNMIDLGDLVKKSKDILPENSKAVLDALEECVVYKVNGDYRKGATGLSCYHSFDGDQENLASYIQIASSEAFADFYQYGLLGEIDDTASSYLTEEQIQQPVPEISDFSNYTETIPVTVGDDGYATLTVNQDVMDLTSSVSFLLAYIEDDLILYLGTDNDVDVDWDNGVIKDNFRGVWGAIDGHLVYMELTEEGDDYNIYSVPITLNSVECVLRVYYDYNTDEYIILGAKQAIDEDTGMADKELIMLNPGDTITTRMYASTISGDDEDELYDVDTFEVTENTAFAEEELGDGTFLMQFELDDARCNSIFSESAIFDVTDGDITVDTLD